MANETTNYLSPLPETIKRLNLPQYYQDPYVGKTQADLYGLGAGLIEGKVPDFYKDIAVTGSPAFTKMLASLKKGVTTSVYEDVARQ